MIASFGRLLLIGCLLGTSGCWLIAGLEERGEGGASSTGVGGSGGSISTGGASSGGEGGGGGTTSTGGSTSTGGASAGGAR